MEILKISKYQTIETEKVKISKYQTIETEKFTRLRTVTQFFLNCLFLNYFFCFFYLNYLTNYSIKECENY